MQTGRQARSVCKGVRGHGQGLSDRAFDFRLYASDKVLVFRLDAYSVRRWAFVLLAPCVS